MVNFLSLDWKTANGHLRLVRVSSANSEKGPLMFFDDTTYLLELHIKVCKPGIGLF